MENLTQICLYPLWYAYRIDIHSLTYMNAKWHSLTDRGLNGPESLHKLYDDCTKHFKPISYKLRPLTHIPLS